MTVATAADEATAGGGVVVDEDVPQADPQHRGQAKELATGPLLLKGMEPEVAVVDVRRAAVEAGVASVVDPSRRPSEKSF